MWSSLVEFSLRTEVTSEHTLDPTAQGSICDVHIPTTFIIAGGHKL